CSSPRRSSANVPRSGGSPGSAPRTRSYRGHMKKRPPIATLLLGFIALVPLAPATVSAGATCASSWRVVPTPQVAGELQGVFDVTVRSPNDVWAVGRHHDGYLRTLVEHWDGSSWHVVPSPDATNDGNILSGVS